MRTWLLTLSLGVLFALSSAATADESALTNKDIVKLTQAGIGTSVIVAKIASSETAFDTSVEALIALSEREVEQVVLAAMLAANNAAAETQPDRTSPGVVPITPRDSSSSTTPQPRAIPGSTFSERLSSGGEGPEMVVIPAGSFRMGCLSNDDDCFSDEKPVHQVRIPQAFAVSKYEVTFADYDRFTHPNKVADKGWGRGQRPVINVSWKDAKEYVEWLSTQTGAAYRLLSEAEWEYAARAGSTTKYSWGDAIGTNRANCDRCGSHWDDSKTAPAGSFRPNAFGLHDMHGNVWEWVEDCWNESYAGAPADGSAWLRGDCANRVVRGGSWYYYPRVLRSASRIRGATVNRINGLGFRVARTLSP